jgi:hypothetical protein
MSEILDRVRAHVDGAGLDAGYVTRYWRWLDQDLDENTPAIVYRIVSPGPTNSLLQQTDVLIMLLENPTTAVAGQQRMEDIRKLMRGSTAPAGAVRIEPVGIEQGPFYLENGRPWWQINVRIYTEDQ